MKRFFYHVRAYFGIAIVAAGAWILPKDLRDVTDDDEVIKAEKEDGKLIEFKDLTSYTTALSKSSDMSSRSASACNKLIAVSKQLKCPARLAITVNNECDSNGEVSTTTTNVVIGSYSENRWNKIRSIEMHADAIFSLVDEMITAMAYEGWSCMDDSVEQFTTYMTKCLHNSKSFVSSSCQSRNTSGNIRLTVLLLVYTGPNAGVSLSNSPKIITRISATVKDRCPVESTHTIFFSKKAMVTA